MRNKPQTSETSQSTDTNDERVSFFERAKQKSERIKQRPYVATTLGVLCVGSLVGVPAGADLARDNISEYFARMEKVGPIQASGGKATVEEIDVNLHELCLVSYKTNIQNAKASLTWEDGIFDKRRQVTADMTVQNRFCQDATVGKAIVDHTKKTYDLYVNTADNPDAIYLDTHVEFGGQGKTNRPFSYSFSGSGTLIPEAIADAFVENTGIKEYTLPNAFGIVMDSRESMLLNAVVLKGEQESRKKCGPKIIEASEEFYKDNLLEVATGFIRTAFPEIDDYKKNVYIGTQSPEDPDRKVDYRFRDDLSGQLLNAKADGGASIEPGEVSECQIANNVIVSPGGEQ